jgi:ABC-2 type transport system ATP-binding protein
MNPDVEHVVLRMRHVTKRFGRLTAVDDLNLELRAGEVFGFLGPNGSGKSTTVGMILGLVAPSAGQIEAFGLDLRAELWSILRRVGAVIEQPAFYPYLSGVNNLRVIAKAVGDIPSGRIEELLSLVGLADRAGDRYDHYSLGMKQRLGIASTLLRDPDLIILDEPTNGLDPAGMREVRELIPRLAHEGRAVFLCSHLLHEVEQVCDRVALIKEGRLLAQGRLDELVGRGNALQIRVANIDAAYDLLRELPWVPWVERNDGFLVVGVDPQLGSEVNAALAQSGIYLSELRPHDLGLESVFLQLIGEV